MAVWTLDDKNLKRYPHFDSWISKEAAVAYASDAATVTEHRFYPFMLFKQSWTKFAKKGEVGKPKVRPIRYAARRDAYIFSRYRHILSEHFESVLKQHGLSHCIIAYRRLKTADGTGKCNVHFAHDAVMKIRSFDACGVIAADVSKYFESLDHERLKELWCRLLSVSRLPPDHFQVFKAITQYAVVNKLAAYERLGHFGIKKTHPDGREERGYLTHYKKIPRQLCRGKEFQEKIVGEKSLIRKNRKPYGIPQGAPLSDLLANLYLLDFDVKISKAVEACGGAYYRYSDDILVVVPGGIAEVREAYEMLRSEIKKFGRKIRLKPEKSSVYTYARTADGNQSFSLIEGSQGKNGLEYLGFRYDGRKIYIRDSTISNLKRKVTRAAQREARACVRRFPGKNLITLKARFNYERLVKQFGRVEDFGELHDDYRAWTFWTYARRASAEFGPLGTPILRQLKRHRADIHYRADRALTAALSKYRKRMAGKSVP